jgi:hypothetical protein
MPPMMLTVMGMSEGKAVWRFSHAVGKARVGLMLLREGAVLFVENQRVGRISSEGSLTPLCELPPDEIRSVVGLVNGDLIVGRARSMSAYVVPGAPELATRGWVMHGAGPAQDWAVRAASFISFPAGVADPATEVAYVQTDSGTTTALALAGGAVRWRTPHPAKPVGIWNGRLIVLAVDTTGLRLVQLDRASGDELSRSQLMTMPSWVVSPFIPWGGMFSSDVHLEGTHARVTWQAAINGGTGGATIEPHGASGGAEVDLASGVVLPYPTASFVGARPVRTPIGAQTATVGGRRFTMFYTAIATLTASDVKSRKTLWTRQLWNLHQGQRRLPPAP